LISAAAGRTKRPAAGSDPFWQQPMSDGSRLAPRKDMASIVARNHQRAEGGDKLAQSRLGFRYLRGEGVERNELQAKRWLRAAAEQGDRVAAEALEELALRAPSRGGARDGHDFAGELQRGLQLMYRKEIDLAAQAFERCCRMPSAPPDDEPSAAYNLGCCYALQGRVDAAVAALRDAIGRGLSMREIESDPDRAAIFGTDDLRYTTVWAEAASAARTAALQQRDFKRRARQAAQTEAELTAAAKLEAARDHIVEAREAYAGADKAESVYKMKGMGDRPILFATLISYHEAEIRLAEALRSPTLAHSPHQLTQSRELDTMHASISKRFDRLAARASRLTGGAAELQRRMKVRARLQILIATDQAHTGASNATKARCSRAHRRICTSPLRTLEGAVRRHTQIARRQQCGGRSRRRQQR
jgi:tetratricopeptide (TPR) repeat protein